MINQSQSNRVGFSIIEVMVALSITMIVGLAMISMINNESRALQHFTIRDEMLTLMVSATMSGDGCKSVSVSGGTPVLGACGTPSTPQIIGILHSDGSRVDTSSSYVLQGVCNPGFYALQIKSALPTKIDPFNKQAIGAAFFSPAVIRFAERAWVVGGCP